MGGTQVCHFVVVTMIQRGITGGLGAEAEMLKANAGSA